MVAATNTPDLGKKARVLGIKYFLVSFVDLFGVLRSKLIPARAISDVQRNGARFAGFSTWLDMTPADPDVLNVPDPRTLIRLPWKPEIGWLAGDLWMQGREVEAAPRSALKRQVALAYKAGYRMQGSVACEFFLITAQGKKIAAPLELQGKPDHEQQAPVCCHPVISEIYDCMAELGWGPRYSRHEYVNGQFRIGWDYADTLVTADRHVFFKFMVKSIAEKHGLCATFMPKPFSQLTGNGCHAHASVWDRAGRRNLFLNRQDKSGLSVIAYQFLSGIMRQAQALCAFFNPTVNSYRRINAAIAMASVPRAENTVKHISRNHSHLIRTSSPGYLELRLMDGSTNPYLMQAGILATGLAGAGKKRAPGRALHLSASREQHKDKPVRRPLPTSLREALRRLDQNKLLRANMGDKLIDAFLRLKLQEWQDYASHGNGWEWRHTIDC